MIFLNHVFMLCVWLMWAVGLLDFVEIDFTEFVSLLKDRLILKAYFHNASVKKVNKVHN